MTQPRELHRAAGRRQVEALGPAGEHAAARLRQVRREQGLTLRQLAARLHRPLLLSALSKIEKCQRRIDVDDLVALASALGVPPAALLPGPGTPAPAGGGPAAGRARWRGWLLTLNCGHLELTDLEDRQPGQLTTCDMCPLTVHSPDAPGRPARQVRLIVSRAPAEAPAAPATVDPSYWYTT